MENIRRHDSRHGLAGLLGGLVVMVMVGLMATQAQAFGTKYLLSFAYRCDVDNMREEMEEVSSSLPIWGAINHGAEFCQKFVLDPLNLTFCEARRDAMRDVIEGTGADCTVTDDFGGGVTQDENSPGLQVLCHDKRRDVLKVLREGCEQIHTLTAPPP